MDRFCFILFSLLFFLWPEMIGQVLHEKNISIRKAVDIKRSVEDLNGREALLRSREFIREDSTYYVGYMFEGIYRANHATDFFGFQNAIPPLAKALELLEEDYYKQLSIQSSSQHDIYYSYQIQSDFQEISAKLLECYLNTEDYHTAFDLINNSLIYPLQLEYYYTPYTAMAWLINKVKGKKNEEYPFLKNSVSENLQLANTYLDSAILRMRKNNEYNKTVLPGYLEANLNFVAHYKAMIYTYDFQIDSADKYYDILRNSGSYSHNNRGNYLMMKGYFRQAEIEYANEFSVSYFQLNKDLKEFIYYNSFIDINKNFAFQSIDDLSTAISNFGTTPGYGWYNIALARAQMYDGNLIKSEKALNKAERFKELHVGTSLTQWHYEFAKEILRYNLLKNKLAFLSNRYSSWWWKPSVIWQKIQLEFELYVAKYKLSSQLMDNPEREMVIYKLFASESVCTWDELMYFLEDLRSDYFYEYFELQLEISDDRPIIKNYFRLMLARMYAKDKNWDKVSEYLSSIDATEVDEEYEKLFLARVSEIWMLVYFNEKNFSKFDEQFIKMYAVYPVLVGYADVKPKFNLIWLGQKSDEIEQILKELRVEWTKQLEPNIPMVKISVIENLDEYEIEMNVVDDEGNKLFPSKIITESDKDVIQYLLARQLFGMSIERN